MKKLITYCSILLMFSGTGCATTLQINNKQGENIGQPQFQHVNRWAWGLWQGSVYKPDCSNGIHSVTVTTTFGEKLATFFTLGIYCPVNVTWFCGDKNIIH